MESIKVGSCVKVVEGKHKHKIGIVDRVFATTEMALVFFYGTMGGSDLILLDYLELTDECED